MTMLTRLAAAAAVVGLAFAPQADAHDGAPHPDAGGPADAYVFPLAAPGAYALPVIRPAADAALLDETGAARALRALLNGRYTVLAFIYTRCGDVCPLATERMAALRQRAAADPALAGEMLLLSLSFDPEHDTPGRMAAYASAFRADAAGAPPWLFLTARDAAAIAPVIAAYDQSVARKRDPDDAFGPLAHVLRVFLIDPAGDVRNIYSADFLDPRLVLNDVRTLRLEAGALSGKD